jgi:hypothetical protein
LLARRLRSWRGEPLGPAAEEEALAFPQLRRALSCRLAEIGDFYELADVESARKALNMATAIEAELSFGAPVDVVAVDGVAGTPEPAAACRAERCGVVEGGVAERPRGGV